MEAEWSRALILVRLSARHDDDNGNLKHHLMMMS